MPAIDVLMPVYNGAETVEDSVRSLCAQTFSDIQIILVDDGSTDESPEILERLAQEDQRITLIRQKNGGIVAALNKGLSVATSPIVARLDNDDLSDPNRLEIQKAFLDSNPQCVAVGCGVRHIDAVGAQTGSETHFPSPDQADPWWAPSREPYIIHPFLMVRRDALMSIGGYRSVQFAEDADLYWRLRGKGGLVNLKDVLGDYRFHPGAMSGSVPNARIMAAGSQLAAISERRRLKGEPDVDFDALPLAGYRSANSLQGIYDLAKSQLAPDEAKWLYTAMAVKMLELSGYRPFELERDDVVFISKAWPARSVLTEANQRDVWGFYARTIARFMRTGMITEALILLKPELAVSAGLRFLKSLVTSH